MTILLVGGYQLGSRSVQYKTNTKYVLSRYSHKSNVTNSFKNTSSTINLPSNTEDSSNWAGYIDTPTSSSGVYTSISGSWKIPTISASQSDAVASQWIGLGGVSSTDLLQMGSIEQEGNGQPIAEVFWEKLPDVAQNVMSVPIGSTVTVNISKASSSTWNLTFSATLQTGKTQTKTITENLDSSYDGGVGTSAEWISEDPSNANGQLVPLANMGTVNYQSARVDGQPLNSAGNTVKPVALVSSSENVLIYPSIVGPDNQSFSTTSVTSSTSVSAKGRRKISTGKSTRIGRGAPNNQRGWKNR
jgi:hypothetical protein